MTTHPPPSPNVYRMSEGQALEPFSTPREEVATVRVLLIEQYQPLGRALKRALDEEGFTTDVACTIHDDQVQQSTAGYDVIVLDLLRPPPKAGLTLVENWRRAGLTAPVLVLAPPCSPRDHAAIHDVETDHWLTKPFGVDEFIQRVRALAPQGTSGSP